MTVAAGLAALADEELTLVLDGRVEELEQLASRRDVLLAALGSEPVDLPTERAALEHALRVQALAGEALRQRLEATTQELGRMGAKRAAAQGYRKSTHV
jgi:hypothetical protein